MLGKAGMAKADRARPIATRLANLDREPEQARGKVPRRGKLEPTRHAQAAVEVQNDAVGRKAPLYDLVAKCIEAAGVHVLFPSIGRWVQLPAEPLPRGEKRGVRGDRSIWPSGAGAGSVGTRPG